jgi:hypothetical protein
VIQRKDRTALVGFLRLLATNAVSSALQENTYRNTCDR